MKPNESFTEQSGDIEQLKKTRATKKKTEANTNDEEQPQLTIVENDTITQELTKANITDQVLRELAEYKKLTVSGLDDKEGYEKVKNALTLCRNTRVLAVKICKKGREAAIAEQRAWIRKEGEVSAQIEETEAHLKTQKDVIDKEKDRIVAEREEAVKTRMQSRTTILLGFGMAYNGETFELAEGEEKLSINTLDVKLSDDTQFNILQLKAEILHEKSKIRIAAEQQAAAEEKARVEAIAAAQEAERLRLEAVAKEQAQKIAEMEAQQRAIDEQKKELERQKQKEIEIKAAEEAARVQAQKDKEEALAQAEKKRLADIAALEKAAADKLIADKKAEELRVAAEKKKEEERLAAEVAQKAAEARAHELLPDKSKLEEFAGVIEAIQMPDVKSEEALKVVATIKDSLNKLAVWTRTQTNKLQ